MQSVPWIAQCLPEKRGDFRGNAGTEEGTVPARVEKKERLVEDERDLPPWILGWKIGLCVCVCVYVCMFKRARVSECQREKAWVCWDKPGSLWGCCFPGTPCEYVPVSVCLCKLLSLDIMVVTSCWVVIWDSTQFFLKCRPWMAPLSIGVSSPLSLSLCLLLLLFQHAVSSVRFEHLHASKFLNCCLLVTFFNVAKSVSYLAMLGTVPVYDILLPCNHYLEVHSTAWTLY